MPETLLKLHVDKADTVSAILQSPREPLACLALAHGAGAGMTHAFMTSVAEGLVARGVATLRYQFPYMEHGSRRPDRPARAQATVRAAVAMAADALPSTPLFAGGKSFGGRMTSLAQADAPLPGVHGLVFLAFPLHPAGKPSDARGAHLADVRIPMLFVQGTRDALAEPQLLRATLAGLADHAALVSVDGADHSFHVPARSGRTDAQVLAACLDRVRSWIDGTLGSGRTDLRSLDLV